MLLVVVLGHERCGAVAAALEVVEHNTTFPGVTGEMVEPIIPAVLAARPAAGEADHDAWLDASVRMNARRVAGRLRTSQAVPIEPLQAGKLKVVAACYDLEEGSVDFFDEG